MVSNTEEADFSACGASKEHISGNMSKIIVSSETRVWQLALTLLQNVLHGRNLEFQLVDIDSGLICGHQRVARVLWIGCIYLVTPS